MPNSRFRSGRRDGCGRAAGAVGMLLLMGATQGCAISYIDTDGNRHTLGLVDITMRTPAAPETVAGDVVEVTSLGLSIGQNAQGGYLTAGYNRQTTAALRDNALVLGNPVTALRVNQNKEGETGK